MNKSDDIGSLALALSKLQGEIKDVYKENQGYGYKYSNLPDFLSIARPLLCKHKLSFTQLPGNVGDAVSLTTVLMHESGQWISSSIQMPYEKLNKMSAAQSVGSILTYARRYALTALLGFAATDEDTDAAEPYTPPPKYVQQLSEASEHILLDLMLEKGVSEEWKQKVLASQGVKFFHQLSEDYAIKLIEKLKSKVVQ